MPTAASESRTQVFFMLLSAAVFAYFGFAMSWAHQYTGPGSPTPNVLIPMVAVLKWTLRAAAVGFGVAALVAMAQPRIGSLLYSVTGLVTAIAFLVVAIWEWTNPQGYFSGVPAILLLIFAAWNGYGSWAGLREAMERRQTAP